MPNLDDLRRARAAAVQQMQATADALTAAESAEAPDEAAIATAQTAFTSAERAYNLAHAQVIRPTRRGRRGRCG